MTQPPSNSRTACLSAGQLAEFERIVASFEQEWLAGRQPEIEPSLPRDATLRPAVLAELVRIDAEFRSKAGKPVAAAAYVQRFPELADDESLTQSVSGADGATVPERPMEHAAASSSPDRGKETARTGTQNPAPRLDERLLASRLVSQEQLRECLKAVAEDGAANVKRLAAELLRRRLVTGWQLDQLNAGRIDFFIDQNRYLLLSLIGQGGMGAVYRARHVRMNRDVAVKVIDPKRVTDQKLIQRFRREVEVCSKLQHEHIVQAHDVGEHAGATFLVLEFVEGADLASLVRRNGPMAAGNAAAICLQAAAGLAYAHSLGIVHRDIKPQNILLSTAGIVKILDMGLARMLDETGDDPHTSLTQEGAVMGTIDYMPPEQARDTRQADARSDIYSLGATLYYLLAGHPPFPGGSIIERLHRLAVENPVPIGLIRADCPPVLDEIVQKMLAKRPEDRFPSAGDVIRALQPLAALGIPGPAVVTPAVQSASDTLRAGAVLDTSAEISFIPTEESIASSIRSRTAPNRKPGSLVLAAGFVAVLLAIVAGWQWNRLGGGGASVGQGDPSPVVPKASKNPEKEKPREIVRQMPGHFANVNRVAWSPDGKLIATGGFDGEVRVRKPAVSSNNTNFSQTVTFYRGHRSGIHNLVWSRTGKLIASGDLYGEIHVWQALTGEPIARVKRKSQVVTLNPYDWLGGIALSPDDRELAFEENGNVVRYNIPEKRRIPVGAGGGAWLCYSPSGKYLASSAGPYVWDTKTGTPVYGAPSNPTRGAGVALIPGFLHDDTLVLMSERNIRLWNCRDNSLLRDVELPLAALGLHSIPLVALSPTGERCRALTVTEAIDIELPEGTVTPRPLKQPLSETSPGNRLTQYRCWDVEFVQGRIAVGPNVFDGAMGGPVFSFPDWALGIDVHGQRWIGDSYLVAGGVLWDVTKGEITSEVPANAEAVEKGRFRYVESANTIVERTFAENEKKPFSSVKCEGLEDEPGWRGMTLADGGQTAWSARHDGPLDGGMQGYRIRFWDAAKGGQPIRTLSLKNSGFEAFAVSRDGRIVVSVVGDRCDIYREGSAAQPLEIRPEYGVDISRIALSPDGRRIAIGPGPQSGGEAVTIWDTGKGAMKPQRIAAGLNSILDPYRIQFSSSGRYLLVTRKLWDVSGEKPVLVWEAPEQDHAVALPNDCALRWGGFCPDERHVAIAQDGVFQIWDWREKKAEKLATIFLLPTGDPVFANHLNGHVSWSPASNQFLRVPLALTDGSIDWVSLHEYETRTGWKNDFEKAGLDLRKRTRESNAAAGAPRP